MLDVAKQIALHLGDGFEAVPTRFERDTHAVIRCASEDPQFGVYLIHKPSEKKIHVSPEWPVSADNSTYPYSHERPDISINVSDRKTPQQVAGDITRRFLPDYREAFAKGATRRDEHDAYSRKQAENLAMFAELAGGTVRGEEVEIRLGDTDRFGYVRTFRVGADSCQADFRSVPVEVMKRILAAWKAEPVEVVACPDDDESWRPTSDGPGDD